MKKKAIFLTSFPPGSLYLIEKMKEHFFLDLVVIQKKNGLSFYLKKIIKLILLFPYFKNLKETKVEFFYLQNKFKDFNKKHSTNSFKTKLLNLNINFLLTKNINTEQNFLNKISNTKIDYIFVLGGEYIKKSTLKKTKAIWINGHGGVLPFYRGVESEYWAIKKNDIQNIGSTIHLITEKIDSGRILNLQKLDDKVFDKTLFEVKSLNQANLIDNYLSFFDKLKKHKYNIDLIAPILMSEKKSEYFSSKHSKHVKYLFNKNCRNII